jgi:hypothetical protein
LRRPRLNAPSATALRRNALRRFDYHQAGDELLDVMDIEVDRRPAGVRFGYDSAAVLRRLDVLSWQESVHKILLQKEKQSVLAPRNFTQRSDQGLGKFRRKTQGISIELVATVAA